MDSWKLGSAVILLALVGWIATSFVTLATSNDLFLSSEWQAASAVTLGFFVLSLAIYIALGKPWTRWSRTAYW